MRRVRRVSPIGLAWRPETAWRISQRADLRLSEVVAESVLARHPKKIDLPPALAALRRARPGLPVIPHGVSLSLGSADGIDLAHVARLAALAEALDAPFVSEHFAYVSAGGVDIGHLTAIPYSEEMLETLVRNIERAQRALPVPLVLENIASLFEWPDGTMGEAEFIARVVEATGVRLLLDVANLHASAVNAGIDPLAYLDALPLDAVAYVHIAGGHLCGGLYHDTHADPVVPDVLDLLGQVIARGVDVPVMLEHDDRFPPHGGIEGELERIAKCCANPPTKRAGESRATLRTEGGSMPLAQRQVELARALVHPSDVPAGFDSERIGRARHTLDAKKRREAERASSRSMLSPRRWWQSPTP